MQLIHKSDLSFIDGMVLEANSGQVLNMAALVDEYNELVDLSELVTFATDNVAKIKALSDGTTIEFKAAEKSVPKFTTGEDKPATPLADAAKAEAVALAEEFLTVGQFNEVESHLARYKNLAEFLSKDYVLVDPRNTYMPELFKGDVLAATEDWVLAVVKSYHDPAVRKLIKGVRISR